MLHEFSLMNLEIWNPPKRSKLNWQLFEMYDIDEDGA